MKKENRTWILVAACGALVIIAVILMVSRSASGTMDKAVKSFAVADTAAVNKIFLADADRHNVLLERVDNGWMLNGKYEVMPNNIEDLLNCIANISVKAPVSKSARENINKRMATGSVKVEIYYNDYRIRIGKLRLWKCHKIKRYYIGQQTMDNLGNYALLEGAKIPCVVYLPGFRGFVRPKYSPLEDSWRTHNIVKLKMSKIQKVSITDYENAEESFIIMKGNGRHFNLFAANGMQIPAYDTLKLLDHLSDYRNLNYEMEDMELSAEEKAAVLSNKFKEVSITDIENHTTTITMYRINTVLDTANYEYNMDFISAYNKDKFYAVINGNTKEIFLCQFFVFDRIVQPLSYYMPGNESRAIPVFREITD